jgi:hypothetical protein
MFRENVVFRGGELDGIAQICGTVLESEAVAAWRRSAPEGSVSFIPYPLVGAGEPGDVSTLAKT